MNSNGNLNRATPPHGPDTRGVQQSTNWIRSSIRQGRFGGNGVPGTPSRIHAPVSSRTPIATANANIGGISSPCNNSRRTAFSGASTGPRIGSLTSCLGQTSGMLGSQRVQPEPQPLYQQQAGSSPAGPVDHDEETHQSGEFSTKLTGPEGSQAAMITPVYGLPNVLPTSIADERGPNNQSDRLQTRGTRSSSFNFTRVIDPATGEEKTKLPPAFVPRAFQHSPPVAYADVPKETTYQDASSAITFGGVSLVRNRAFEDDHTHDLSVQRAFGLGAESILSPIPRVGSAAVKIDIMERVSMKSDEDTPDMFSINTQTLTHILLSLNRIESKIDGLGEAAKGNEKKSHCIDTRMNHLENLFATVNEKLWRIENNQDTFKLRYTKSEDAIQKMLASSVEHGRSFKTVQETAEMLGENQSKLGESFAAMYNTFAAGTDHIGNTLESLNKKVDRVVRNHSDVEQRLKLTEFNLYNNGHVMNCVRNDVQKLLREQQEEETHYVSGGELNQELQAAADELSADYSTDNRFPGALMGQLEQEGGFIPMAEQEHDVMSQLEEAFNNGTVGDEYAEYYDNPHYATPRHRREMRRDPVEMKQNDVDQDSRTSVFKASAVHAVPEGDQENAFLDEGDDKTATPGNSRAPTPTPFNTPDVLAPTKQQPIGNTPRSRNVSPTKIDLGVHDTTPTVGSPLKEVSGSAKNSFRLKNKGGGSVRGRIENLHRM